MATITQFFVTLADIWVDPTWLYAIVQVGVLAVFVGAAYRAWRHSGERLLELLSAVLFGLLLEEGDIIIFQTYRYDPHWLAIDLVPPAIALCWAMIIASAMNFSDSLGIDERLAPFADAVWVIILDLALDAVAIRLGMWRWTIPLDKDWFGVPYSNFFAWLWVAAAFSYFTRAVRRRRMKSGGMSRYLQVAVPLPAYGGLLAAVSAYVFLQAVYFKQVGSDWILITLTFAAFGLVALFALRSPRRIPREAPDAYLVSVRYMIHLYFLSALVATGIFLDAPVLLIASLTMLTLETVLVIEAERNLIKPRRIFVWANLILNRWSRR